MKLARFDDARVGVVVEEVLFDITPAVERITAGAEYLGLADPLIAALPALLAVDPEALVSGPMSLLSEVQLLAPVRFPSKLISVVDNYAVVRPPQLITLATTALAGPCRGVARRFPERRSSHEVSLAVVIGKNASDVPLGEALDYVAGYAVGLGIVLDGCEERGWRSSVDGYAVVGPWMVSADELRDREQLDLTLHVNGELRQAATTAEMVLGVPELVAQASRFCALHPGDVILSGTPDGSGPIEPGDVIVASIGHIGSMEIPVHHYQPARARVVAPL